MLKLEIIFINTDLTSTVIMLKVLFCSFRVFLYSWLAVRLIVRSDKSVRALLLMVSEVLFCVFSDLLTHENVF